MVFSSILFMFIYLPVVLAVYYIVPLKWRNLWLFAVNFVFYGWGEPVYVLLMLFSITINYAAGMLVGKFRDDNKPRAKKYLIICIVVNLGLLVFFKYSDMIINTVNSIAGSTVVSPLGLALPIGISFYTFQAMSYPIDVYRGDANAQRSYVKFGTYIALFPQLIAGPIVRYKDIDDQLTFRVHSVDKFASGVRRFMIGLAKKVLIANNIGALWTLYSSMDPSELTVVGSWLGILAFTMQIYFDFSGYSDMAIGLGRMLGFEFLENFNYPYIAKSVTEFWRRWHISLGTWFRDYVYIPLGGNRKGEARQYLNILIVWGLTGLWHGASWTFLLWGLYYAVLLIIEKKWLLKKLKKVPAVGMVYTFLIAVFGWVLFQTDTLEQAGTFYKSMFGFAEGGFYAAQDGYYLLNFAAMFIIAFVAATPLAKRLFNKLPEKVQSVAIPVLIVLTLVVSTGYLVDATYNPFLYFRF